MRYQFSPHTKVRSRSTLPIHPRKLFFIGIFIIIISSIGLIKTSMENNRINQWQQELVAKLEEVSNENVDLKNNLNYVSNLNYHEKKARDQLNMQEPGEKVVDVQGIDKLSTKPSDFAESPTPTPVQPNWKQWYSLFVEQDSENS